MVTKKFSIFAWTITGIVLMSLFVLATTTITDTSFNMDTTGSANLSGMLYVNSTNVGIGTDNPVYKLDVSGNGRFTFGATDKLYLDATSTLHTSEDPVLEVWSKAGADDMKLTGVRSIVIGFADGHTNGKETTAFFAGVIGDGDDTDQEYIAYRANDFVAAGGGGTAIALSIGADYDYLMAPESGDILFGEYTPVIISEFEEVAAATEAPSMDFGNALAKTWAAGAGPLAAQRDWRFIATEYVGDVGGALTITDAATVYIDAAPTAGADMTITNAWAFWTGSGSIKNTLGATDKLYLDATSTTHTGTDGALDIDITSATEDAKGIKVDFTGSGHKQSGIESSFISSGLAVSTLSEAIFGNIVSSGSDNAGSLLASFDAYFDDTATGTGNYIAFLAVPETTNYDATLSSVNSDVIISPTETAAGDGHKVIIRGGATLGGGVDGNVILGHDGTGTVGLVQLPANTTAMTCNEANAGAIYYDEDPNKHYGCDGSAWQALY